MAIWHNKSLKNILLSNILYLEKLNFNKGKYLLFSVKFNLNKLLKHNGKLLNSSLLYV